MHSSLHVWRRWRGRRSEAELALSAEKFLQTTLHVQAVQAECAKSTKPTKQNAAHVVRHIAVLAVESWLTRAESAQKLGYCIVVNPSRLCHVGQ